MALSRTILFFIVLIALTGCGTYPAATPTPWPTKIPTAVAFATPEARAVQGGQPANALLQLPGKVYQIDLAVHPLDGWPIIGAMSRFAATTDPIQVYAQVYNPLAQTWSAARQLDIGEASNGDDRNGSITVAVTAHGEALATWGASDADGGIWTSSSRDYGTSWSQPTRIATDCTVVNGMAATLDGQAVVLAMCGRLPTHPTLIVRDAIGAWGDPHQFAIPGWFGTVVTVGDGPDAQAVAFVTGHGAGMDTTTGAIIRGSLGSSAWTVNTVDLHGLAGDYFFQQRGLAFSVPQPDGTSRPGIVFTWKGQYSNDLSALVSLDGGQTWGQGETLATGDPATGGERTFPVPGYDPTTNRLVALWACCGQPQDLAESSHYAAWRGLNGTWVAVNATGQGQAIPVITGARSAGDTVSAQARNSRLLWLAWIERRNQVAVRSLPLEQLIPVDQNPPPTARPTFAPASTPAPLGTPEVLP